MFFPLNERDTSKPPVKIYIKELFEGSYETKDEVKEHIGRLTQCPVSDEFAHAVFRKLLFVIYSCCSLMAEQGEVWWATTYRNFIEYAVEHDDFDLPECQNIWKIYPRMASLGRRQRSALLRSMPKEFVEKECYTDDFDYPEWRD